MYEMMEMWIDAESEFYEYPTEDFSYEPTEEDLAEWVFPEQLPSAAYDHSTELGDYWRGTDGKLYLVL